MDQFRLFPPQASTTSHEVDALFFALTLISLFFMAVIFLPIIFFSVKYRRGTPANAIEVQVVGKQWMWKLQHAEGKREINELHLPVNTTVAVTMTSQDVIHSFFVPAFRVKQDVVPGKY